MWWEYYSLVHHGLPGDGWYIFDYETADYADLTVYSNQIAAINRAKELLDIKIDNILIVNE